MAPLNLPIGATSISVKVQPVVLFSVCDAYNRRGENQERVIGTLLGTIADGVVEVKNSYAVPHNESQEQVAVDIAHHKTLHDLNQKVNSKEVIIGWYSTGAGVSASDSLIQDFYARECQNPVHLTVDTTLQNSKLSVAAYVSRSLVLADRPLATEFQQVPCEVRTAEAEKVGVDLLDTELRDKLPSDTDGLHGAFRKLQDSLEAAQSYVNDVVTGKRKGDITIGRYLADTVAAVPYILPEEFDKMFTDSAQDVMLISYLSNLIRSHVALADRLGTAALPLM